MRKVARRIDLVDRPNERKYHSGAVPLVGGISIYISLVHFLYNNPDLLPHTPLFTASITILTLVGALDDKFDVSFKLRFIVQGLLSIVMMSLAKLELNTIGDMFGFGIITFDTFGYLITILAVVGAINAFNMVDGIDGLLGGLSIVTFSALASILYLDGKPNLAYLCVVLIVIILPYIGLNLGILGRERRIFMGDAGSMLIGFTVIWLLLLTSQEPGSATLRPVTALWLIAVPLMDMAAIMIRRIRRGDSPFKPDREHLHHIFQRLGLNAIQTLLLICSIAALFAGFGIYAERVNIPEYIMFYLFMACFVIYMLSLHHIYRVTAKIHSKVGLN